MTGMSDAMGWLSNTLDTFNGETGTIRRGSKSTTVTVVRGRNRPKLMSIDGQAYIELEHQEILIKPSQYTFSGISAEPLPGDRIVIGSEEYVTVPYLPGEGVWRYLDQYKTYYRIHVQLVSDG